MIDKALDIIRAEVDNYLKVVNDSIGDSDEKVVLVSLIDDTGEVDIPSEKVALSLISVEEERGLKAQSGTAIVNGASQKINPEIKLNLYVLFSSNYTDYKTALKQLSNVILFFQGKNVFDKANTPSLAAENIDRLILDLVNQNSDQQYDLWTRLGVKYLPSVVYRIRMLTFQANFAQEERPLTQGVELGINKL